MKIGILTYHRSVNYGAYMQAYCLQNLLSEKTGYEVEIIDYDSKSADRYYVRQIFSRGIRGMFYNLRRHLMFQKAREKLSLSPFSLVTDDIIKFNELVKDRYDLIVVGSDEVWRVGGFRPFPNAYWLPDIRGIRKVTYAVSSRNYIGSLDDDTQKKIKGLISDFEYITVRDNPSKQLIDGLLASERKSYVVCDPTLAYDFQIDVEEGRRLIREKFHTSPDKITIAIMDSTGDVVRNLNVDNEIQFISLYSYYPGLKNNPNVTPEEWVQIISASDGLITAFFHGMCIALSSDTPFLFCEEREEECKEFSKGYDLLHRYDMDNYFVQCTDEGLGTRIKEFINSAKYRSEKTDYLKIRENEKYGFDRFAEYLKA